MIQTATLVVMSGALVFGVVLARAGDPYAYLLFAAAGYLARVSHEIDRRRL